MQLNPEILELRIRQMTWEAEDVLSLGLVHDNNAPLPPWEPGAHIDVILEPDLIRQYSLCGEPGMTSEWKIAVLREPNGSGGSRRIHETMRPGMVVAVSAPRNNFSLAEAPDYLFVAGGIGVTPILPMLQSVLSKGADFRMLYGGRRHSSMAFLNELAPFADRVKIWPEDKNGLLPLESAIDACAADTAIYCCGPEPLIAAVEAQCTMRGRNAPHVERFAARPGFLAQLDGATDTEFEIVLARKDLRFTVPIGKTIIEVLKEANVFVPTSCTEGYCGTCETEVLAGIPDHRDDYLTPNHRDTNKTMMICVGRSKSPELVLNI